VRLALAVIVNAIVDALAEFDVEHLEMPVTPERIWRAIEAGKLRGAQADKSRDKRGNTSPKGRRRRPTAAVLGG
jgi:hypothetical protein